jgi:O-antigen/teichoic acid export membrane protein
LVNSLTTVLFTGFSLVKTERERLISAMRTLVEISCIVIFPLTAGMAAAAPQLVGVMLGSKWRGAEPLIQWLALGTAFSMTGHLFAVMAEAVGRLRARFVVQAATTAAALLIYFVLARYGLFGSTIAFALTFFVFLIAQLALSAHILRIPVTQFVRWMLPGLTSSVVVVAYVLGLRAAFGHGQLLLLFVLEIGGCAVTLTLTLRLFFPRLLAELMRFAGLGALMHLLFLPQGSRSAST